MWSFVLLVLSIYLFFFLFFICMNRSMATQWEFRSTEIIGLEFGNVWVPTMYVSPPVYLFLLLAIQTIRARDFISFEFHSNDTNQNSIHKGKSSVEQHDTHLNKYLWQLKAIKYLNSFDTSRFTIFSFICYFLYFLSIFQHFH